MQDGLRRVVSRSASDTSAGVRTRAAQVQTVDWRGVARPTGDWTEREELIEAQVAVENIATGQSVLLLEVER
jgi:hypothetical protein